MLRDRWLRTERLWEASFQGPVSCAPRRLCCHASSPQPVAVGAAEAACVPQGSHEFVTEKLQSQRCLSGAIAGQRQSQGWGRASRRNYLLPRRCSRWLPRTEASGRRNCWHSARSFRRARSPLRRCATPRRTRRVIGLHLNSGQGCLQSCGRPCPSSESGSDAVVAARTAEAREWRRVRAPHHLGGTEGVAATKMPHLLRRRDRGLGRVERSCSRVRQRFLWRQLPLSADTSRSPVTVCVPAV